MPQLDDTHTGIYKVFMRFLPLPLVLTFTLLLASCATEPPAPPLTTPSGRPEVKIHAPIDRVRAAIIAQQAGEGATLANQSENRIVFVTQSANFATNVLYGTQLTGAPYVRSIYTLTSEPPNTHVFMTGEIVSNYGTAFESAQPVDSPQLRQALQKNLLTIKGQAEKR